MSLLQTVENSATASATTIGVAITAQAGSYLQVDVTVASGMGVDVSSVTDGTHTYTQRQDVNDATNNQRLALYTTGPLAAGGTFTVTANLSATMGERGIIVREIGASSGLLASMGQHQATPGTGANGVSSGLSGTLGSQPALICGLTIADADASASTPSSGFTDGGNHWTAIFGANGCRAESQALSSTASIAATYTAAANSSRVTTAAVWSQTAAATTWPLLQRKCNTLLRM